MKYSIKPLYKEPRAVVIEFDSVEELNAAVVIITLHNLSSLYKVIVKNMADCSPFTRYTIDGRKVVIQPSLVFRVFVSGRLECELRFLDEQLRRSYESI